jgi:hypothetical protein
VDLLELVAIRRRGSSPGTRKPLSVDLRPEAAAVEGVSCALTVGARYVERVAAHADSGLRPPEGGRRPNWIWEDLIAWRA